MSLPASDDRPRLGLMLGDATGIGPELCARILHSRALRAEARILVVGDARVLDMGIRDAGVNLPYCRVGDIADVDWNGSEVTVLDLGNFDPTTVPRGAVSAESGRVVGETLSHMISLALAGHLDGITFAPLNKAALNAGGWRYPDEHQMFAQLTGHEGYFGEMNVLDGLWVSRATSHVALRNVVELITQERVTNAIMLADTTLRAAGLISPRLAVSALNPHAGEGGLFGVEEMTIIEPAMADARARGVLCEGPFPADTVFLQAFGGRYDGVVTMYHDQGQIATKLRGFARGVTVTAGLNTVFTTPAHGTAFDIVGRGEATTGALEQALRLAARLAAQRQPTLVR